MSPTRTPVAAVRTRALTLALTRTLAPALVVAALVAPAAAVAQGAGSGATTLLRIAPGPRPLSLGNAYVAVRGPLAVEYNPAGLSGHAIAASYQTLPVDAVAGAAQLALPFGDHALGVSLRFLDYGEVAVIEPDGAVPVGQPTGAVATGGELSALLGAAFRIGPLRLGLAGRWLRQDVAGLTDDALAADLGALLAVADWLDVGASVQHVGPDLEAGRPAPLPTTVRLGAAGRGRVAGLDVLVTAEARRRESRDGAGVGLELSRRWEGAEAGIRLGFETRPAPGDAFSPVVVGGDVRLGRLGVELAWRALGPLGSTRQLGLRYRL